jgi:hypothetical protein
MRLFLLFVYILTTNLLYSQSKIKYTFELPQRDSLAVRPYKFIGTYRPGILNWSVEFEKEESKHVVYVSPNNSTSNDNVIKPNGVRVIQFRFQFFDSKSKIILDTAIAFEVDLKDGYALEPATDIIRFKHYLPEEPYKANLIWSYSDFPDIKNKKRKLQIAARSYVIELASHQN